MLITPNFLSVLKTLRYAEGSGKLIAILRKPPLVKIDVATNRIHNKRRIHG